MMRWPHQYASHEYAYERRMTMPPGERSDIDMRCDATTATRVTMPRPITHYILETRHPTIVNISPRKLIYSVIDISGIKHVNEWSITWWIPYCDRLSVCIDCGGVRVAKKTNSGMRIRRSHIHVALQGTSQSNTTFQGNWHEYFKP